MTIDDRQAMPPTAVSPLDAEPLVTLAAQSTASTNSWRIWLACFGLWLAPAATVSVSPIMNSVAMDARSLTEAQIGMVRTLEILLNAGLTIWLSLRLGKLHPRPLGLIGLALLAAGNFASAFGTELGALIAARLAAGAGAACVLSAGSALVARIKSPQRLIGGLAIPVTAIGVISAIIAGQLVQTQGQIGAFGPIAAASLFAIPFALFAPARLAAAASPRVDTLLGSVTHPYVLASAACYFGSTAVWTFFARIALALEYDAAQVGFIIAGVSIGAGLMGALGALARDRWVRPAVLVAIVLFGACYIIVPLAPSIPDSRALFLAAFALACVCYALMQNFFTVVAVRLDRTGALNAAGNGWASLANALAPWTAGALITASGSFAPLAVMTGGAAVATFILLWIAMRPMPDS